ncbi:YggS family pyridoxal phosphate-dependent enzyme [Lentisalinibacter sediminis]|uniref:YggS family pyridoxal phosphate-dependent enzyme n=1 Tax=Lentisalinibacter sediminis TaxID=2992237 RepID=UPI00386DF458
MIGVTENLRKINESIASIARSAGRDPAAVTLVAVSKRQPPGRVREAVAAGQRHFGENTLQGALAHMEALGDTDLVWHFIGAVQSNKTRPIAERFDWVHTIEREKIARRLSEARPQEAPPLDVCIQVNVDDEASKSGCAPEEAGPLADLVGELPRLRLRGLMCIPAPAEGLAAQRRPFARLRGILEELNARGHRLDTLSMGMSADLEAAILEGATLVRVGTDVFGPRPADG